MLQFLSNKKIAGWFVLLLAIQCFEVGAAVRLKEVSRVQGVRENPLVGYGIVVGLAGTGDSSRSDATMQSITNALRQFGVTVSKNDVSSRNVAVVIVESVLPPFAQLGDKLDVNVSSMGDARSLVGGTLLMMPLKAANDQVYALAQGPVSVGGFKYDLNGNSIQKNHPTVGLIPQGAIVERATNSEYLLADGSINIVLNRPDFTTASRVKRAVNAFMGEGAATALHAGKINIKLPTDGAKDTVEWIMLIEDVRLTPDKVAKVVINERTGTVVSGGGVMIDDVTISHGDIRIVISTRYQVSQPNSAYFGRQSPNSRTVVVPETDIEVEENMAAAVDLPSGATISDLVTSLRQIKASTRDVITIIQAIMAADALHAQLIIQ